MASAEKLIDALKKRGWMLAAAESCTAGLISAAITDVAGSSAVFDRGFVTYSNEAKFEMLGVKPKDLAAHGAVSEQVAVAMARGALVRSNAQIAVSVTGVAGPGGSDHKPEGRVCFAIATQDETHVETVDFGPFGRTNVRAATVEHALKLTLAHMNH